jgi:hypothetical protein
MLSRLSSYFKQNVIAFLALFVAMGGTGAYAANTIGSSDIIDGQVKSVDVGDAEIKSADVKDQSLTTFDVSTFIGADIVDGSLTAKDVGENEFFNFQATIDSVPAQDCKYLTITGVAAHADHLLLTPNFGDSNGFLTYGIEFDPSTDNAHLKVCNPTTAAIDDGITNFNLLVFQH